MWNFECRLIWNILAFHFLFRIFPIHCIIFEVTSAYKLDKKKVYKWCSILKKNPHFTPTWRKLCPGSQAQRNPGLMRLTLSFSTFSRTVTSLNTLQCQSHNSRKQKLLRITVLCMYNILTWSPIHLKEVQIQRYTVPLLTKTWFSCLL